MSGWFQKPENALTRANELTGLGHRREAVEVIQGVLSTRKHRLNWTPVHEKLQTKLLSICVELKDHRTAKDSLHQ